MSHRSAHRDNPRTRAHAGPRELRLNVTSDPANLAPVRRACEAFCRQWGLDEAAAADVGLVVNEAMANVTRHAYGGATDQPICITGRWDAAHGANGGGAVRIQIRDWGSGEEPPQEPTNPDPATPGGLGMVCIRCLMDEAVYEPQRDGMLLTLTKKKK
jgi:anti-sigma regulatory factor (Ser/Thr protein kinase)